MNIYDASKFVAYFYFNDIKNFGENPFHFNEWTVVGSTLQNMKKSYTELGGATPGIKKKQDFLNSYKMKKLS